jgi:hypothetical protein
VIKIDIRRDRGAGIGVLAKLVIELLLTIPLLTQHYFDLEMRTYLVEESRQDDSDESGQ